MGWRVGLLSAGILLGLLAGTESARAASSPALCAPEQLLNGTCASSDGTSVTIDGQERNYSPGEPALPATLGHPLTDKELLKLWDEVCFGNGKCRDRAGGNSLNPVIITEPGAPGAPGAPARTVTIEDLERFLPAAAELHAEPDGWAVVGVPANFWVDVEAMTVDGELLGEAAQVRFTPQLFQWRYGDGGSRRTEGPGASWADLGQEELTVTATGHVYRARADLRASVAIVYSAEYRVGDGPWVAVDGAVTATTPPARVLVVAEHTVLTNDR